MEDFQQARQLSPDSLEANRGLVLSYLQAGALREAAEVGLRPWLDGRKILSFCIGSAWSISRADKTARAQELLEQSAKLE